MECGPLLRLSDSDPAVQRSEWGRERERIRLQSAMGPDVGLQLGGRTGSVEVKAVRSEPVLSLRSVLTAEASLYSLFFIPDLAAGGECRPWPRPPPPLLSKKVGPPASERLQERVCALRGRRRQALVRRPCAKRELYARRPRLCSKFCLTFKGPISRTVCAFALHPGLL